jgi:DNA-binding FadR family transcriptional regulator
VRTCLACSTKSPKTALTFTKTLKRRAYEDIVDQIDRRIITGGLKLGDRLPSERDLIG